MRMSLAGTNLSNEQPGNGRAKVLSGHAARRTDEPHPIRFMVPMRFKKEMEAFHEPEGRAPITCGSSLWWGEATDEPAREDSRPTSRFMAPMRVQLLEVEAFHEPEGRAPI